MLEEEGFTTVLQAWDFRPGANFVQKMQQAATEAERTIAVISPDYLDARYTHSEWQSAFAQDPMGEKGTLLPVRVRETELTGLLAQIIYIDLVGLDEQAARKALHRGIKRGRGKPLTKPPFPTQVARSVSTYPQFPGPQDNSLLKRFHDSASVASWISGGLILLILILGKFVEIDPGKIPTVRFLMALSVALFALFFVGGVLLRVTLNGLYISATGSFVLFILIQFVFSPSGFLLSTKTIPTPTPIANATPVAAPTHAEVPSQKEQPSLLAEFVLDDKGEPQFVLDKEDKVKKHYRIMFFVREAPPDVTAITYDPWDPSFGVKTYTSYSKPDFKLKPSEFTTYGDDQIEIIVRTKDSESRLAKPTLISAALEQHYMDNMSEAIRDAFIVIKNNLQGE